MLRKEIQQVTVSCSVTFWIVISWLSPHLHMLALNVQRKPQCSDTTVVLRLITDCMPWISAVWTCILPSFTRARLDKLKVHGLCCLLTHLLQRQVTLSCFDNLLNIDHILTCLEQKGMCHLHSYTSASVRSCTNAFPLPFSAFITFHFGPFIKCKGELCLWDLLTVHFT